MLIALFLVANDIERWFICLVLDSLLLLSYPSAYMCSISSALVIWGLKAVGFPSETFPDVIWWPPICTCSCLVLLFMLFISVADDCALSADLMSSLEFILIFFLEYILLLTCLVFSILPIAPLLASSVLYKLDLSSKNDGFYNAIVFCKSISFLTDLSSNFSNFLGVMIF